MLSLTNLSPIKNCAAVSCTALNPGLTLITGPNGSGKSTLLQIIAGLKKPFSGTITTSTSCSYLGHNTGLYHSLTVKENLLFFSKISGDKNLGINTSIKTWGLEAYQNQTTLNLSQGLSIRAGLARAFLSDAPILLLDEPSANLDDEFKKVLLAELKIHSSKKYIFIATHEPSLFHELSPEVINLCL